MPIEAFLQTVTRHPPYSEGFFSPYSGPLDTRPAIAYYTHIMSFHNSMPADRQTRIDVAAEP